MTNPTPAADNLTMAILTDVYEREGLMGIQKLARSELDRQREEITRIIKNSRTVSEQYGIGKAEQTARDQILTDLLTSLTHKDV